jgi:hypothetical protein
LKDDERVKMCEDLQPLLQQQEVIQNREDIDVNEKMLQMIDLHNVSFKRIVITNRINNTIVGSPITISGFKEYCMK